MIYLFNKLFEWRDILKPESLKQAKQVYLIEKECIEKMADYFDEEAYSKAVELIKNAERIGATGCGHSGIICQHFAHLMCCIERAARFISPAEAVHGATGYLQKDDVCIFASRGGKTKELLPIFDICKAKGVKVKIQLRIKPGIDAHTHDYIRTGQIDSKFGFSLENGEAMAAALRASEYENIELLGVHCHIASQVTETEPFCEAADVMMNFINEFYLKTGVMFKELNLGGGFGVKYVESDGQIPFDSFLKAVSKELHRKASELSLPLPKIYIEPGRSIVGPAGVSLYTVGAVKIIENIRTYVSIDGGMCDNPRYALYQADYTIEIANKANKPKNMIATVAGKCCESGDLIQEHTPMQEVEVGDILAVLTSGAYQYSMASNYNRIARPAVVMVKDGEARVIIKRETYEDIIKNDL